MIIGVGTDVIEINRMAKLLTGTTGEKLVRRVLTATENQYANTNIKRRVEFIAGRFSVKEAVVKALGCGIGEKVGFQDIEILPDSAGKPHCHLSHEAIERLGLDRRRLQIHVSISHSERTVVSFAVAEAI